MLKKICSYNKIDKNLILHKHLQFKYFVFRINLLAYITSFIDF